MIYSRDKPTVGCTPECHPREETRIYSHQSTTTRRTAAQRRISTDPSTVSTEHLTTTMDPGVRSAVGQWGRCATSRCRTRPSRLHHHRGTTRIKAIPALMTVRKAQTSMTRTTEINLSAATAVSIPRILSLFNLNLIPFLLIHSLTCSSS